LLSKIAEEIKMNGNKVTIQHKTALQNMDAQLANKRDRFI
jgi:hypothetical protein